MPILVQLFDSWTPSYLVYTVCTNTPPGNNFSAPYTTQICCTHSMVALCMQLSSDDISCSVRQDLICKVKLQALNVSVTYENNGIVTIEPTAEIPADLSLMSAVARNAVAGLILNLQVAQSTTSNILVETYCNYYLSTTLPNPVGVSQYMVIEYTPVSLCVL